MICPDNISTTKTTRENNYSKVRFDRFLTYVALRLMMSDTNESNENIETAQKNQKKIGAAEDDAEITGPAANFRRSEEHMSELQSLAYLVCRLLLEKKKQ